jgi:hypothetical protein
LRKAKGELESELKDTLASGGAGRAKAAPKRTAKKKSATPVAATRSTQTRTKRR